MTTEIQAPTRSVLLDMADRFGMNPAAFEATLRNTVIRPDKNGREASREEFAAFLLVAKQYNLNPLTKEIYAFADKGRIIPIVSVDGWANIINSHPQFDGMDFADTVDDKGKIVSSTCRIHRKDRNHPIQVTEYLAECSRNTEPWEKWPARMLRHKALIQCARYAFGFAGIYDQDEAERIADAQPRTDASRVDALKARLTGPTSPGFSHAHVEREVAAVSVVQEPEEPSTATTLPAEPSLAHGDVPAGRETASQKRSAAWAAGVAARKRGTGPKAVPADFSEQEMDEWSQGWAHQDKYMTEGK